MWKIYCGSGTSRCFEKENREENQLGELKITMYYKGKLMFPCLKSKAAETRHLCGALLSAFDKLMDTENEQHKLAKLMLTLAVRIEALMDENKDQYKLEEPVAEEWKRCCSGLVQANAKLGHYYHPKNIMLFHFTIKFHYLLHIGLLGKRLNPRLGWCYRGEKMMMVVKSIVQASHLGCPPWLVVNKVMTKYARGLSLKCWGGCLEALKKNMVHPDALSIMSNILFPVHPDAAYCVR